MIKDFLCTTGLLKTPVFAILPCLLNATQFQVFNKYNNLPDEKKPKSNNDRIDMWMTTFSKTVNYNLTPLFEFWGLPLSDQAKASVSGLKPFFPDDEITQKYGPDQAAVILEKYPDVVRIPAGLTSKVEDLKVTKLRYEPEEEVDDESYSEDESGGEASENERDELWMGSTYSFSNLRVCNFNHM